MKTKLLLIFVLILNLAHSQVKDTLSVSALTLTKQEVTYNPAYNSAHPFYLKSTFRFYSSATHKPVFVVGMV